MWSVRNNDAEAKWIWFDSNTWQSYDDKTNKQIEHAYINGVESVKLNCGPHFGYENIHHVYFNYNTNPPSFNQVNIITKDIIQIKRTLTFKPRHLNNNNNVVINHQKIKNNNNILSNIKRIQIYKHLYTYGFNKQSIDKAIKIFNIKFKCDSPILNESINNITNELIKIIKSNNNNNNHINNNNNRFNKFNNNKNRFKFNFEYHKNNKKYDSSNAKHPSEYINRKCFKCKGNGKCNENIINKQFKCNENIQEECNKCINSSGIFRKSHSLIHSKCNGLGCNNCNDSGKYPLYDILCNNCNNNNNSNNININNNINNNNNNQCMNGYRLPQLIPFVPKRDNKQLSVHGIIYNIKGINNMKRLYHATNKKCADDIIKTGVMFGEQKSQNGIYFSECGRFIQIEAKKKGYNYCVIADVFIGKCKDEYYIDNNMNFNKLHKMGYDSIRKYSNQNGIQYIVFNWDQVWVHIVLPFQQINFAVLK